LHFDEIEKELRHIDKDILLYPFKKSINLVELAEAYKRLVELQNYFINNSLIGIDINRIEGIRFRLLEEIHLIKIYINEKLGQQVINEIDKLKLFYEINENIGGDKVNE
jgi:hypothetical protein